jgi:hypothetical protein
MKPTGGNYAGMSPPRMPSRGDARRVDEPVYARIGRLAFRYDGERLSIRVVGVNLDA